MILALIFLGILIIICMLFFLLIVSTIRIKIDELQISNKCKKISKKVVCEIGLYLFGKMKIIKINLNNKKIKEIYLKEKNNYKKIKNKISISKNNIKNIKKLNPDIITYNMHLEIGLQDAIATSCIIVLCSSVISYILAKNIEKYDDSKYNYIITPIYSDSNIIDLKLKMIIDIKILNLIYFIMSSIKFNKKSRNKIYIKSKNKLSFDG